MYNDRPRSSAARPEERRALITLFWCAAGPGWANKAGWQDGENNLREWCGIGLDPNDDSVTLVDLRRNRLTGAMPPEVGDLTKLRHLYLGDNELQGSIPKSISQLTNLCILSLRGNKLKGDVVPELGNLSSLRTLSLRDNHFTGTVPRELGRLTGLKHLFLNNNNIRGSIPVELSELAELEQMFLADNELEGPIPLSFGLLTQLEELVLSGNNLTGPIPVKLSYLKCLTRLELDGNQLTGDIPPSLCELTSLKILYLNNNNLTGPIPPNLGSLSWLERLDFSNNQLTGCVPPELGQLFSLELLILNNNRLTGSIPSELGRLHHITLLVLSGNQLSEAAPIVGGKGLRQWQLAKQRAYQNSWSMMDRLAYLERENAELRKQNDVLRKQHVPVTSNGHKAELGVEPAMRVELPSDSSCVETAATVPTTGSTPTAMAAFTADSCHVPTWPGKMTSEDSGTGSIASFPPLAPCEGSFAQEPSAPVSEGSVGDGAGAYARARVAVSTTLGNDTSSNTDVRLLRRPEGPVETRHDNVMVDEGPLDRITARRVLLSSAQRRVPGMMSSPKSTGVASGMGAVGMGLGGFGGVRRGMDPAAGFSGVNRRARSRPNFRRDAVSYSKLYRELEKCGQESGFWNEDAAAAVMAAALAAEVGDRDNESRGGGARVSTSPAGIGAPRIPVPGLSPVRGEFPHHRSNHQRVNSVVSVEANEDAGLAGDGQASGQRTRAGRLWASLMGTRASAGGVDEGNGSAGRSVDGLGMLDEREEHNRVSPISLNSPMAQLMPWLFQRVGSGGELEVGVSGPQLQPESATPTVAVPDVRESVGRVPTTVACSPE